MESEETSQSDDLQRRTREALAAHHPQKWHMYEQCVLQGQAQKELAASTGLSGGTLSEHLTDAICIMAAYQEGIWNPDDGPFSYAAAARRLGVTKEELRRRLVVSAVEERECVGCHKPYRPKKNCGESSYHSRSCRLRASRRTQAKVCGHDRCDAEITDGANYCVAHHLPKDRTDTCARCGEEFATGVYNALYCPGCKPLVDSERSDTWRQARKVSCADPACRRLVSRASKTGLCSYHAVYNISGKKCPGCHGRYWPTGWGQVRCPQCIPGAKRDRNQRGEEKRRHPCANQRCANLVTRKSAFCNTCRPGRGDGAKELAREEMRRWEAKTQKDGGPDGFGRPIAEWLVQQNYGLGEGAAALSCARNTLARALGYPKRQVSVPPAACRRLAQALGSRRAHERDEEEWESHLLATRPPGRTEKRKENAERKQQQRDAMARGRPLGQPVGGQKVADEAQQRIESVCKRVRQTEGGGDGPSWTRFRKGFGFSPAVIDKHIEKCRYH